jgi:NAD(P)-dependent dehydrogenase (short-subunit alcohol dehydrogenase family)
VVAEIERRGGTALANSDSVADYGSARAIVEAALGAYGRLDILVNNASVFRDGPFEAMTPDDFAADISVHLFGTFNLCKHAIPVMVEQQRGRIVNTTSGTWHSASGLAAYAAAKGGIVGLSFDLAAEYWRRGITVNVLAPSAATEHRTVQGERWMQRLRDAGLLPPGNADVAIPRLPEPPENVPPIVVYLASDAGASITGKVFEASGNVVGVYAHPEVVRRVAKDPVAGAWTQEELGRLVVSSLLTDGSRAPHVHDDLGTASPH